MTPTLSPSSADATVATIRFVVTHGKAGALGIFASASQQSLRRGQRVLVQTDRGVEAGTVLCAANSRQAALLQTTSHGQLLRSVNADDDARRTELSLLEQDLFAISRSWAARDGLAVEVLDVEVLFDGSLAIVQFVGPDADTENLALALERHFNLTIQMENLAATPVQDEESHGCDKPDCGKNAGGGCSTCGTGGSCSSCGSGKVDLREYFGHLRGKMEDRGRVPLV